MNCIENSLNWCFKPRHDQKSVTYSNDLKLILNREKLVSTLKLNAFERLLIQAQAQQEKVHLAESEAVKNIGNILKTINELILEFEQRVKARVLIFFTFRFRPAYLKSPLSYTFWQSVF